MRLHTVISVGALAPVLALSLAACGSEPDAPPTAEAVAEAAGNLIKPTPGLYRSSASITEFEVPGMPPQQAAQMKEMMGSSAAQSTESCLTAAQAEEGFQKMAKQLSEGQQGVACEFDKFDAAGSKLDADLTCSGPGGANVNMEMDGDIEPEKSTISMKMTQKNAGVPGGEVRMVMQVKSERIGDCP